jgi:hypothetical protein
MVRINPKIGEKQLLTTRVLASTIRLYGDKNGVNIFERLGIIRLQNPALLAGIIFVLLTAFPPRARATRFSIENPETTCALSRSKT